jgi:Na+/H+ antiporter NhaD/arsenite permease-like protein
LTPWEAIKSGIIGDGKLKPYAILLLIVAMSVICTALDFTGALSFFAFHLVSKFVNTRLRLLTLLYILSSIFGIFSSSHSVVMTTAPLIHYITTFAKISSIPYLFAGFYAANISSLFLLIGNPTNVIVGTAMNVSFADFTKFMFVPAVIALTSCYIMLLLKFHDELGLTKAELFCCRAPGVRYRDELTNEVTTFPPNQSNLTNALNNRRNRQFGMVADENGINGANNSSHDDRNDGNDQLSTPSVSNVTIIDPSKIYLPTLDPSSELKDRIGAVFHTFVLLAALVLMGVSSFISKQIELWHIALPASVISLLYCLAAYPFFPALISQRRARKKRLNKQQIAQENADEGNTSNEFNTHHVLASNGMVLKVPINPDFDQIDENVLPGEGQGTPMSPMSSISPISPMSPVSPIPDPNNPETVYAVVPTSKIVDKIAGDDDEATGDLAHRELCFYNILLQTPYDICLFLSAMFILVQSLVKTGWVEEISFFVLTLIGGRNSLSLEAVDPLWSRRIIIVVIFTFLTIVLSNLLSAQPATIFLTRLLITCQDIIMKYQQESLPDGVTPSGLNQDYQSTMVYTVIACSNYAGVLTLIGSISGIIFAKIVNAKVSRQEVEYTKKLEQLLLEQQRIDPKYYRQLVRDRSELQQHGKRLAEIFADEVEVSPDEQRQRDYLNSSKQLSPELRAKLPVYFDDKITYTRFSSKGMFILPGVAVACGFAIWLASFYAPGIPTRA